MKQMSYNQWKQFHHIGTLKAKLLRKILVVNISSHKKMSANKLTLHIKGLEKINRKQSQQKEENSRVKGICKI